MIRNTSKQWGRQEHFQTVWERGAQLYIEYPASNDGALRALRGFELIHLAPGETRRVKFNLSPHDLSRATDDGEHVIQPATYSICVGGSQPKEGAGVRASFQVAGELKLPR